MQQVPDEKPPSCANSTTVTIPFEVGVRFAQVLQYESQEWRDCYPPERNSMEGKNRFIKNFAAAAIANPDHRRMRGYGKQHFTLLVKLVGANFQTIIAFLDAEDRGKHEPPRKKMGRPVQPVWTNGNPDATGPPDPLRIAGRVPTKDQPKTRKRKAA